MPVTRHKPRNWRCRLGLLFSGLWATSKASAQVSNAADGSLNLESRTSAAAVEALNNAKGNLLRGSFSAAVEVASPYCGHILKATQGTGPPIPSILQVTCLNLLGVAFFMEGEAATAQDAFLKAYGLIDERHHTEGERKGVYDLVELEVMKNLQWTLQAGNEEGPMLAVRQALTSHVLSSNGLLPVEPLAKGLSISFFDLGLAGKVCSRHTSQGSSNDDGKASMGGENMGARLYLDLVKRCVTHFLHTDFPSGQGEEQYKGMRAWDIPYRMRDFQTLPPKNGRRFEDGFTTKEVGVLELIEHAAMTTLSERVEGHWLEAGVWRGGTALMLGAILKAYGPAFQQQTSRQPPRLILADSFEGIPADSLVDWDERYAVSKETVMENFRRFGFVSGEGYPQVSFVRGFFSQSLPGLVTDPVRLLGHEGMTIGEGEVGSGGAGGLKLSLLLADADAYDSTWDILVHLYPSVTVGGYVVVDDFHIPECRAAILKYRQLRGITEPMLPVPTDYAYGCKFAGDDGSRLPPAEEGGMPAAWPHAMYWRRQAPESDLQPFVKETVASTAAH